MTGKYQESARIVDRLLETLGKPTTAAEQEWMKRLSKNLKSDQVELRDALQTPPSAVGEHPLWKLLSVRPVAVTATAVLVVVVLFVAKSTLPYLDQEVLAKTEDGRGVFTGESIASLGDSSLLSLVDGSSVEMGSNTQLAVNRVPDGLRIDLTAGSVIVSAAKQHAGSLYVQTSDCLISVVGTVFSVSAAAEGSRVSVIEGEVRVRNGTVAQTLLPGQQISTNAAMESLALPLEIGWSRSVSAHLALVELAASTTTAVVPVTQGPGANATAIDGVVIKMGTNEPLSRATVVLETDRSVNSLQGVNLVTGENLAPAVRRITPGSRTQLTTMTDDGGRFAFTDITPGRYRLWATRTGYLQSEFGQPSALAAGSAIVLDAGKQLRDLRLEMLPAGVISGRIQDSLGEPTFNLLVRAMKFTYRNGEPVLTTVYETKTNDLGEYRLTGLQPGRYLIGVIPVDGASPIVGAQGTREVFVPSYFPGITDVSSAAQISLAPGASFNGGNFTIAQRAAVRVKGRVTAPSPSSQSSGTAVVKMVPRYVGAIDSKLVQTVRAAPDGEFEFAGIVAGSYDVVASLGGKVTGGIRDGQVFQEVEARLGGLARVDVGVQDIENLIVTLHSGVDVSGKVQLETALGTPAARIAPIVGLQSRTPLPSLPPAIGTENTFTFRSVLPGEYRLSVGGLPKDMYVKSARLDGVDALNSLLQIDRQPQGRLDIVVSGNAGVVDGLVIGDKQTPEASAAVVLIPDPPLRHRFDLYRTGFSNRDGRVRIEGLAPGNYKAFAWKGIDPDAWQNPALLEKYESRGKGIRINEGTPATIELRLIDE